MYIQNNKKVEATSHTIQQEDVDSIISSLSKSFATVTQHYKDKIESTQTDQITTTELYDAQIDFAHLLHLIKTSPLYNVKHHIRNATNLIEDVNLHYSK